MQRRCVMVFLSSPLLRDAAYSLLVNSTELSRQPSAEIAISPTAPFKLFIHPPHEDLMSQSVALYHSHDGKIVVRAVCALRAVGQASNHTEALLDVGANIGVFALTAAAGGQRVVAIEAMRYNTEVLAASIERNGWHDRVALLKTAVGAAPASMCVRPAPPSAWCQDPRSSWCKAVFKAGQASNGQLVPASDPECQAKPGVSSVNEIVQVSTIDSLLRSGAHGWHHNTTAADATSEPTPPSRHCIAVMKIDVEGYESLVLAGARELLSSGTCPPCHVIFEYAAPNYGLGDVREIFKLLVTELGYKCHLVSRMTERRGHDGTRWDRQVIDLKHFAPDRFEQMIASGGGAGSAAASNASQFPPGQYECVLWRTLSQHPRCQRSVGETAADMVSACHSWSRP